jgi:group I intron endonuclease
MLQNHYNKYGESDLSFEVLLACDRDELRVREQYFMDALSPWFNVRPDANSPKGTQMSLEHKERLRRINTGRPCSDETKARMSASAMGRKRSLESIEKWRVKRLGYIPSSGARQKMRDAKLGKPGNHIRSVLQYDRDMVLVREWGSVAAAALELGVCGANICRCAQGKGVSAGGFVWKYKI